MVNKKMACLLNMAVEGILRQIIIIAIEIIILITINSDKKMEYKSKTVIPLAVINHPLRKVVGADIKK